jgi:shikimate kinase
VTTKLFIVGRPGSGKSTAAQYISGIVRDQHWNVTRTHIDDYPILQQMTKSQPEKFHLKENGGFDAIDLSVLDIALVQVEQQVRGIERNEHALTEHLVTIEFARDDYKRAFQMFSHDFIQDSYLLFMHASVETCLKRIHFRTAFPMSADDHPSFSDELYREHYANDNITYITFLQQERPPVFKRVQIIVNEISPQYLIPSLEEFVGAILQSKVPVPF